MKVLYISEIYPDPKTGVGVWGGGERQFYEISRRVRSAENEVTVLTCRFPNQASHDSIEGVEVLRQGLSRDPATGGVLKSPLGVIAYIAVTLSRALRADSDLIHCNAYYPIIAGRLASAFKGVPLVATVHDLPTSAEWGAHVGSRAWGVVGFLATRLSLMMADGPIICVSNRVLTKLLKAGGREVHVIPNGVDMTPFDLAEARERSGQVLYVGRLVSYKRVDTLLVAFAEVQRRVPGSNLVVVGDGPERKSLEAKAGELGIRDRVSFRGTVKSNLDVVKIYRESAVFVLPSVLEGEGLVIKEAMAARAAVVAVDSPGSGIADVVKDGVNGYLVPPGEPGLMADRISRLLLDPGERERIGSEGRKSAEKWTWDQAAAETMSVYERALGGPQRPP